MQTIRETSQEGSKAETDEDKTDLQNKTGNRIDTRQGRQDQKTKPENLIRPFMASPDRDSTPPQRTGSQTVQKTKRKNPTREGGGGRKAGTQELEADQNKVIKKSRAVAQGAEQTRTGTGPAAVRDTRQT